MHLFHDSTLNTLKLITEKLPEKPNFGGKSVLSKDENTLRLKYLETIAALKQNALTVGNIEITGWEYRTIYKGQTERQVWTKQIDQYFEEIKPYELYPWPGSYQTKEFIRIKDVDLPQSAKSINLKSCPRREKEYYGKQRGN